MLPRPARSRCRHVPGAVRLPVAIGLVIACCLGPAEAGTRVSGSVFSIDPAKGELVLDDAGHRHHVRLGPGTTVRERGTDKTVGDLHGGDRVVVSIDGDPPVARRIELAGPSPQQGSGGRAIPGFATGLDARTPPR